MKALEAECRPPEALQRSSPALSHSAPPGRGWGESPASDGEVTTPNSLEMLASELGTMAGDPASSEPRD